MEPFRMESFRIDFLAKPESFRRNLFRKYFQQNRNVSEWNHSERIFQKIFLAQPESIRMESFRRNLSENIFSKTRIFQNGIFQKESFRKSYFSQLESFRMECFKRNLSEKIF
jgi:hypothetical protein